MTWWRWDFFFRWYQMLKLWLLYLKQKNICSFWIWFLRASEKTKHDIFCIVLSWCVNCFQRVTGVESRQVSLVPRLFYCASMLMKYAQNILTLSCWIKEMAVPSLSLSLSPKVCLLSYLFLLSPLIPQSWWTDVSLVLLEVSSARGSLSFPLSSSACS